MQLDKTDLVYTEKGFTTIYNQYEPMKVYRHIQDENGLHLVYGEAHTPNDFKKDFKFWYDKIIEDWTAIGLIVNGSPVSFNKFKKLVDLHTYEGWNGRRTKDYCGYVAKDSENRYQFMTYFRYTNKEKAFSEMYTTFTDIIEGQMRALDEGVLNFGNRGLPLSYGRISYKYVDMEPTKEFVDTLFADVKKN